MHNSDNERTTEKEVALLSFSLKPSILCSKWIQEAMHQNFLISLLPVLGMQREGKALIIPSLTFKIAMILRKRDYYFCYCGDVMSKFIMLIVTIINIQEIDKNEKHML
jgi:hypothetical protein